MHISSSIELQQFCHRARTEGCMGMDLEFIPENTYYPQLALIQLSLPDQEVLLDPLSMPNLDALDAVITEPSVVKIVHAGTQDMGILVHRTGTPPASVFDTQVACEFMGMGHQLAYGVMVQKLCGVQLEKSQSRSDWMKRPLSRQQEMYALEDVRYLLPCWKILAERLERVDRLHWLEEDLAIYADLNSYGTDSRSIWRRVRGMKTLNSAQREKLRELAAFREEQARRCDLPRRHILQDETLIALARHPLTTPPSLPTLRGPAAAEIEKYRRPLLSILQSGSNEGISHPRHHPQLTVAQNTAVDFLTIMLRTIADQVDIVVSRLGTREDLETLVRSFGMSEESLSSHRLLKGWRANLVGRHLLNGLRGRTRLRLDSETASPILEEREDI